MYALFSDFFFILKGKTQKQKTYSVHHLTGSVLNSLLATPPPFPIVQRRPRVVVNAYSTGRTPIRYDMVYVLLTTQEL